MNLVTSSQKVSLSVLLMSLLLFELIIRMFTYNVGIFSYFIPHLSYKMEGVLFTIGVYVFIFFYLNKIYKFNILKEINFKVSYCFYLLPIFVYCLFEEIMLGFIIGHTNHYGLAGSHFHVSLKNYFNFDIESIISSVIVAAIFEELLFRGIVQKYFMQKFSVKKSILYSSLIFAVWHINPMQYFSAFLFGLFAGYLYYKTRSLLPCILAHSIGNLMNDIPFEKAFVLDDNLKKAIFAFVCLLLSIYSFKKINQSMVESA